jgi:hypothetical protein
MKIRKYIKLLVPSFIFFAMMEFFFKSAGLSYASLITLFLISISSAFWITRYRFLPIILIVLYTTGTVLFLITLGENSFQQLYIAASSLIFALALVGLYRFFIQQEKWIKDEKIKPRALDSGFNLNQAIILISIFLISSGVYGLYIDLDLTLWPILMAIFTSIFFSTLYLTRINFLKSKAHELYLDSARNKTFNFYSFLLGLIVVELTWVMSFWPANHLTIGAMTLLIYYFCWSILRDYLRNMLLRKTIILNLLFLITFLGITFFTGNWKIS